MGRVYSEWRYVRDQCYTVKRTLDRLVERITRKSAAADRSFLGRLLVHGKKGNLAEKRENMPAHKAETHSCFQRKEPIHERTAA